jgi:hypothetical protein
VLGQLLDGVASVEKLALLAVDVADIGGTTGSAHESWIVCEHSCLGEESPDIDEIRTEAASQDWKLYLLVPYLKDSFLGLRRGFFGSHQAQILGLH